MSMTNEDLNSINRNLESHLGLFSDAEMDRDQKTYCTFRPSELHSTKEAIDELLALRSLRDAGDEEVDRMLAGISNDALLSRGVKETFVILRHTAIARGQQLREAREEIERLDQVVRELKDNFGEMEVGA